MTSRIEHTQLGRDETGGLITEVERHEACEFFQIDGERPYAPHHGPGNDPYIVFDHGTDEDVRTSFRGEVKPPSGDGS